MLQTKLHNSFRSSSSSLPPSKPKCAKYCRKAYLHQLKHKIRLDNRRFKTIALILVHLFILERSKMLSNSILLMIFARFLRLFLVLVRAPQTINSIKCKFCACCDLANYHLCDIDDCHFDVGSFATIKTHTRKNEK